MKSRASCYDPATARMEVRRFFPMWVLYAIGLALLGTMTAFSLPELDSRLYGVRDFITVTVLLSFVYAAVVVQLLFGDLYTARLCYAIHALPITRGGFYGTQIVLGILGALVPNTLMALAMLPALGGYSQVAFWWWEIAMAGYLFFFGTAVFSAISAGNRLGMLAVYAIINFFAVLVYWLLIHVYNPLLYGLSPGEQGILEFSPVYTLLAAAPFHVNYSTVYDAELDLSRSVLDGVEQVGTFWKWLPWYALAGAAALYLGMRLYRVRKLESCGDLLAFDKGKKFFLILFTVSAGGAMHFFGQMMSSTASYVMLAAGLIVGYYAGLMLLKRQVNVFSGKSTLALAGILLFFFVTMTLTGMDLLGLHRRMPELEEIASVQVCDNDFLIEREQITNPEDIAAIYSLHKSILEEYEASQRSKSLLHRLYDSRENRNGVRDADGWYHEVYLFRFRYTLKDGSQFNRQYLIGDLTRNIEVLRKVKSRPEYLFWGTDPEKVADGVRYVRMECNHSYELPVEENGITEKIWMNSGHPLEIISDKEEIHGLVDAFLQDCDLGVTAQEWIFMGGKARDNLEFNINSADGVWYFRFDEDCVNTMRWLREHDRHDPIQEEAQ